jgi:hypothetical protein
MENCTNGEQRSTEMSLEHKNAIVYGGGGSVGGAAARAFSREGASVLYGKPLVHRWEFLRSL